MPRAPGQIDQRKTEAILDAAQSAFAERGFGASLEDIARRAQVSRQTIYNHFGAKLDLLRMLIERRRETLTALLEAPGAHDRLEETLVAYGRRLIGLYQEKRSTDLMRLAIAASSEQPEIGRLIYEAGARAGKRALAAYIAREAQEGRLDAGDAEQAAEMFSAMVLGQIPLRSFLNAHEPLSAEAIAAKAAEAVRRFLRAYPAKAQARSPGTPAAERRPRSAHA